MERRFKVGLAALGVLALLAGVTLEGDLRWVTWLVLGAFALKSWIALAKQKGEDGEAGEPRGGVGSDSEL